MLRANLLPVAVIVLFSVFWRCNNVSTISEDPVTIVIRLMDYDSTIVKESASIDLTRLNAIDIGGEKAVRLEDCISQSLIPPFRDGNDTLWDCRELYSYRLIASDGFSPDNRIDTLTGRPYKNLNWTQVKSTYIKTLSRDVAFDATMMLPGRYRVKDVTTVEIYRKVDVLYGEHKVPVQLTSLSASEIQSERAVKLEDILKWAGAPDTLQEITIRALDGYSGLSPFTWEQVSTGFLVTETDRTLFDPDLGGRSKIRMVMEILLE